MYNIIYYISLCCDRIVIVLEGHERKHKKNVEKHKKCVDRNVQEWYDKRVAESDKIFENWTE